MRNLLIWFCFVFSLFSFGQNKNFTVEDKLIFWKLVYEDSSSISNLKSNPRLEFVSDSTGRIKKTNFEDKKLDQLTAEFKIETKKGKYRVSVFNIKFFVQPAGIYGGGLLMQTISEFTIERALIKKDGQIRESSSKNNLTERLNPHLVELFTIKKVSKSDW